MTILLRQIFNWCSQTETVLNTLSSAEQRSRVMGKALRHVEALPEADAARLIPMEKDLDTP